MSSSSGTVDDSDDEILGGDGYSLQQLFSKRNTSCFAYTYDDIIILPGHIYNFPSTKGLVHQNSLSFSQCMTFIIIVFDFNLPMTIPLDNYISRNVKIKV